MDEMIGMFYKGWVMDEMIGMLSRILNPRGLSRILKAGDLGRRPRLKSNRSILAHPGLVTHAKSGPVALSRVIIRSRRPQMAPPRKDGAAAAKKPRASTKKYIRNLYYVPLNIAVSKDERIVLQARGQRGDLRELSPDDEGNSRILNNIGLTLELISAAEAKKVLDGQLTNAQHQPSSAVIRELRDQLGRPYAQDDVVVEAPKEIQGETVAPLVNGEVEIQKGPGGGIVREKSVMPRVADVPGSDPEMAHLLAGDEAAKNGESLTDILGHLTVED
jgi:hypothetical protein